MFEFNLVPQLESYIILKFKLITNGKEARRYHRNGRGQVSIFLHIENYHRVNCSFYFKIGACRHGDNCTRIHLKPTMSQTLLIPHMYDNPPAAIALAGGKES